MSTVSTSFHLLDPRIQRFIWTQGWDQLRAAQEQAIPNIVEADRDVIVAAATAAGKTEAAMLPALTHLLRDDPVEGLVLYLSPLKALINDQFGRVDALCTDLEIPVWPWHGDISASVKARFIKKPRGVLLMTPESLEALLCNRGHSVADIFRRTTHIVIDELHAFIGSERGKQLQSLMHRLDLATKRRIPRIGLSATLGDMAMACNFLRPGAGAGVTLVNPPSETGEVKVIIKGYLELAVMDQIKAAEPVTPAKIAQHLFETLRGSNNLVFPNSRREVERYTHLLQTMCQQIKMPVEFWPHHGSLSKELRSDTEAALKRKDTPATAICTNTLELGIDIGAVKSVAQIGPPGSVAGLRQRLGRSGRRKGEPAILRGYAIEDEIAPHSDMDVLLRTGIVQLAAMISLALDGWFEPPIANASHFSTLVQQLLSFIAQKSGCTAAAAYQALCAPGAPFQGVSTGDFANLLRHLADKDLISQDATGLLLHGGLGERFASHFSFYAAFSADEEYRLVAGGKPLGSLPVSQALVKGQRILFAGKTWRVEEVAEKERTIYVARAKGGAPPLFAGDSGRVHTKIRQRMREIYQGRRDIPFLDAQARELLQQGQRAYSELQLDKVRIVDSGAYARVFTWLGDAGNEVLVLRLMAMGYQASLATAGLEIEKGGLGIDTLESVLREAAQEPMPSLHELLGKAENIQREKWDWALPQYLLFASYASLRLDLQEAQDWLTTAYPAAAKAA